MSNPERKGLGWYSRITYPLLVIIFFAVFLYYEKLRLDIGDLNLPRSQYLEQFLQTRNEFFLIEGVVVLLGVVWFILVARDKKKHPEKYKRYL